MKRFFRLDALDCPEQTAVQGWLKGYAKAILAIRQVFKNKDKSTGVLHLVKLAPRPGSPRTDAGHPPHGSAQARTSHHHPLPVRALRHSMGLRKQQGQPTRGLVGGGRLTCRPPFSHNFWSYLQQSIALFNALDFSYSCRQQQEAEVNDGCMCFGRRHCGFGHRV